MLDSTLLTALSAICATEGPVLAASIPGGIELGTFGVATIIL